VCFLVVVVRSVCNASKASVPLYERMFLTRSIGSAFIFNFVSISFQSVLLFYIFCKNTKKDFNFASCRLYIYEKKEANAPLYMIKWIN
jgi:hypothetical protein